MAGNVPLAPLDPLWEHDGDQPPKWSTWLRRFRSMLSVIDSDCETGKKLESKAKNEIIYSYTSEQKVYAASRPIQGPPWLT